MGSDDGRIDMAETIPHVVVQGEHLYDLAAKYKTEVSAIWSLAENAPLEKQGRTPEQLVSGDIVYVPVVKPKFLPIQVGQANKFAATVPTTEVTVKVQGDDGKGLANVPFEVPLLGAKGQTDGDGNILLKRVPLSIKVLHVHLTNLAVTLEVRVGHLDPVTTPGGKAQRLAHLGFLTGDGAAVPDDWLRIAYESFCARHAPDAQTDADKERALREAHGS
jgi:hypothetical protein